ncbi:TraM recognition domain-containing protein (plasmid) [Clostridium beijerinckii]|uniref:type IV secretory system conjugative DNA transfer family protein n=1 Tax=Clostridium beijerinckii TaxID=1520 RepID=UPI00222779D8|nr:TraM recognition domain-containing protein [Clostridium beijerinckii]UYZ38956.1 TraM recognition domain-containing protein [Clostridium beijerinckii]
MDRIKKWIGDLVNKTNPKIVDKVSVGVFALLSILTMYLFISTFRIFVSPIVDVHSKILYTFIMVIDVSLFYVTMLGEKTSKPINRPRIFLCISAIFALNIYSILVEIINSSFTDFLNSLLGIAEVPGYLLITNIRVMSIYVPLFIVALVFHESMAIPFKRSSKQELLEYTVDILTRSISEISDRTINLKLCEDIESGEDVILTEDASKQHTLVSGSSGSGKTALVLRRQLAQLFYQKAQFREKLKELAFKCLQEDICYLKAPVTDKYINENFSMELIGIKKERKTEFLEIFKDYIIGIRESTSILYNAVTRSDNIKIPFKVSQDIVKREIKIVVYYSDLILHEYEYVYEDGKLHGDNIVNEEYSISVNVESNNESTESEELLLINLKVDKKKKRNYKFNVNVTQYNNGKIIYRDLGVTVVAPDGGLPSNTIGIAEENGVKVHKIDPKMEEIRKGNIATFNPIMVGTPEKAADVISSILVAMEQSSGKDSNPYFTNASIRAVRNLVILLRVTYPKLNGKNPTLLDVLEILNNFNLVREYVEELQKDSRSELRWKSVIDYFVSSFYPQPKDEKGNPQDGTNEGINRKKTSEAIQGMINQLDNLLGREELRYILCDAEGGLNLSDVLEKGECLAIATRQSELGQILGKAFALMFILSMQNAVLCRYSEDENPEIPHYLVIDELPFYLNDDLKVFFTFSRKYKCSLIVAIQNIAQLCEESDVFKQIIFSNTGTKLILPGSNVEDRQYYSELLGNETIFETQTGVSKNPILSENANYSETERGAMAEKAKVSTQEIAELKFKRCYYVYTNNKGKKCIGKGYIDFLKLTSDNTKEIKYYDFAKYNDIRNIYYTKENENDNLIELKSINIDDIYEEVDIYKNIEEVDIELLEMEIDSEDSPINKNIIASPEQEELATDITLSELKIKDTGKDLMPIQDSSKNGTLNLLEQQLLKSMKSNDNINIGRGDVERKISEKNIEPEKTTNEKYNIDLSNIDIDNLKVEGLSEK